MLSRLSSTLVRWIPVLPFLLLPAFTLSSFADGEAAAPTLEPSRFLAQPEQKALLTVSRPGRYAVLAKSDQGVALRLVDRRKGPGELAGVAGAEDGRLDVLLEPGDYRVIAYGAPGAKGDVRLEAHLFDTDQGEELLPEQRLVTTTLGDFQERSYWFQVEQDGWVFLEAAGRHLNDLRLWRDGGWLVDTEPEVLDLQPQKGRPLRHYQLNAYLPAGLYRLALYGGPGQAWADDDGAKPLYLRKGWPRRAEAARSAQVLGPFGADHFLVPRTASFFRLELPGRGLPAGPSLSLELDDYEPTAPFEYPDSQGSIEKETNPPVVELLAGYEDVEAGRAPKLRRVTVRGTPGEKYLLQHFNDETERAFVGRRPYWISSLHAGDARDWADAGGVLARYPLRSAGNQPQRLELVASDVLELDATTDRRRKFNVEGPTDLYLHVAQQGDWEFLAPGLGVRVMPFAPTVLGGTTSGVLGNGPLPAAKNGSARYALDPGFYVLSLLTNEPTIAEVHIRAAGGNLPVRGEEAKPHGMAQLGAQPLDPDYHYVLYLNGVPGRRGGSVLRALPLDLREALPLDLRGEMELPVENAGRGRYRAVADDGLALVLALDEGDWQKEAWAEGGAHRLRVKRADGRADAASVAVYFEPAALIAEEKLPPVPADVMASRPVFPLLDVQGERSFDLAVKGEKTFLLRATEPALYRIESTGLLDTEGRLRTPLVPELVRTGEQGSGRNFLIQDYLRPGAYQLTVKAMGRSAGHLGVKLTRAPMADGGALQIGGVARAELADGAGVAYRFRVEQPGRYRLRALALGKNLPVRLEDAEGWPLIAPGTPGDFEQELAAGDYRLVVLPPLVGARQITRIDRLPAPAARGGHGPHALTLGRRESHRWLEPAGEGPRPPDVWTFEMPAETLATLELDAEMQGQLFRRVAPGGPLEKVADVPAGRTWQGVLPMGALELHVVNARRNNQVDYRLLVEPAVLLAGQTRKVSVPSRLEVAVGEESLVELSSFGATDVRARLFDAKGRQVASADDRPGDWNFSWTGRLEPGRYQLALDHVGPSGPVDVTMRLPTQHENPAEKLPLSRNWTLGEAAEIVPLSASPDQPLVVARAQGPGFVRLAIEEKVAGGHWRMLESRDGHDVRLVAWRRPDAEYRLRLENLGQSQLVAAVKAAGAPLATVDEAALRGGRKPRAIAGLGDDAGLLAVKLDRPGCFEVEGGAAASLLGPGDTGFAWQPGQKVLAASGAELVLVADPRRDLRLRRWVWDGREAELFLPASGEARCDVAKTPGLWSLQAESLEGQPSLAPAGAQAAQALAPARAATLLPGAGGQVVARGRSGQSFKLRGMALAPATAEPLPSSRLELELSAGGRRDFALPGKPTQLRLVLGRGLVAGLEVGGRTEQVYWADPQGALPLDVSIATAATRLVVVNPGDFAQGFGVESLPTAAAPAIRAGEPVDRAVARAGWYEFAVAGGSAKVHVRGGGEATFLGADGGVAFGRDFAVPAGGGRLLVPAESGLLWAWADQGGGLDELWQGALPAAKPLSVPAVVELGSALEVLEVAMAGPALLHLRGERGGVVAAEVAGRDDKVVAAFGDAISQDLYLPQGKAKVAIRPIGGREGGRLEIVQSPLTATGEGLGPEVLLGPGQSRYFSFVVPAHQMVGFAARAEAGIVQGRLLDGAGKELATGASGLLALDAGTYLLGLSVPADARPTPVRPVLVGLVPRSTLPPAEQIARYVRGDQPLPGEGPEAAAEAAESSEGEGEGSPRDASGEESGEEETYEEEGETSEEETYEGEEGGEEEGAGEEGYEEEGGGEGEGP